MFPDGEDTRIAFQQENPKRPGSTSHDLYEKYKTGRTVREARLKGCRQVDFTNDLKKGFLQILPRGIHAESNATAVQVDVKAACRGDLGDAENSNGHSSGRLARGGKPKDKGKSCAAGRSGGTDIDDAMQKPDGTAAESSNVTQEPILIQQVPVDQARKGPSESEAKERASTAAKVTRNGESEQEQKEKKAGCKQPAPQSTSGQELRAKAITEATTPHELLEKAVIDGAKQHEMNGSSAPCVATAATQKDANEALVLASSEASHVTDSKGLLIRTRGSATATSRYLGVTKKNDKWEAKLKQPSGATRHLGNFKTEEEAAEAYSNAVFGRPPPQAKASGAQPAKSSQRDATSAGEKPRPATRVGKPPAKGFNGAAAGSAEPAPEPEEGAAAQARSLAELQRQIDELTEAQLDRVLEFLQGQVKEGEAFVLDLKNMPLEKLKELTKLIAEERRRALVETTTPTLALVPVAAPTPRTPSRAAQPPFSPSVPRPSAVARPGLTVAAPSSTAAVSTAGKPSQAPPRPSAALTAGTASPGPAGPPHVASLAAESACAWLPAWGQKRLGSESSSAADAPVAAKWPRLGDSTVRAAVTPEGVGNAGLLAIWEVGRGQSENGVAAVDPRAAGHYEQLVYRPGRNGRSWEQASGSGAIIPASYWALNGPPTGGEATGGAYEAACMEQWPASYGLESYGNSGPSEDPPQLPAASLPWFGDDGGWEPGGEPQPLCELPRVPMGQTDPPGACREGCRCAQVVSRPSELEKPWLMDKVRSRLVQEAVQQLESCRGVLRRGRCSRQNRFQPAPVGAYEPQETAPRLLDRGGGSFGESGDWPARVPQNPRQIARTPATAAVGDATPQLPQTMRR